MKLSQLMLFLSAAGAVTACTPSDQHVQSVRERLEAGEAVEFTKPGTNTPNCGRAIWSTIKVNNSGERERVVLGRQASILNAGYKFCGMIGKPVDMTVFKGDNGLGQVIVTKITLVKLDSLKKSQLKGSFFSEGRGFDDYKAGVRLYPNNQGIVTIVDTRYQQGTAVDEKAIHQRDAEKRSSDGFEQTEADGADLSECDNAWSDLAVAPPFQQAVINGRLGSWYSLGEKNCIRQGSTINIKSKVGKDEPVLGKVKVAKVKRFRTSFLEARYFDLRGQDFAPIEELIKEENTHHDEWITVVDFVNDKAGRPPAIKQVTITEDQARKSGDITTTVVGKEEFKTGELLTVNIVHEDFSVTQASAIVTRSVYAEGNGMTFVKIRLLKEVAP